MTDLATAMVFAAGFGTRMGELTKSCPKPLLKVNGKTLLDHALDLLSDAGMEKCVVNAHYLADQIKTHLKDRPSSIVIEETPDILETGGGLKNALSVIKSDAVVTLNSDMIWSQENPIASLKSAWNQTIMDALLMLVPKEHALGYTGSGDFFLNDDGRLTRRGTKDSAPYVFSGAQILKTAPVSAVEETAFSLNLVWDKLLSEGRVYGIVHHGGWVDVGRPSGIRTAEDLLSGEHDV